MSALENTVPPPLVALLCAVAMWLVSTVGWAIALPGPLRELLVAGLLASAAYVGVSALWAFRGARTTVDPRQPDRASTLVTEGVFARSRNPMYLGVVGILLAWAVTLGSVLALLGPVVFVAYITRFQIVPEEAALRSRFGAVYAQYCGRVRRWL
ncbi:MAG: isoprenylcysteine carboxylmethyltransferase family protein [Pseudomonadota bacterium]